MSLFSEPFSIFVINRSVMQDISVAVENDQQQQRIPGQ